MTDGFMKWINKGAIAWCKIQEVKTPYEVEKVVKKVIKSDTNKTEEKATETDVDVNKYTYEVTEDTDTRTGEKIYLAKVIEKLSREEYIKVNQHIKSLGGYYSKFKHAFLFKENPCEKLNVTIKETGNNTVDDTTEQTGTQITYTVTEDVHTKTGEKLFVVKLDTELSKSDFADVKRKLATLHGFYSGFKKGFIFKYDPTEKLSTV